MLKFLSLLLLASSSIGLVYGVGEDGTALTATAADPGQKMSLTPQYVELPSKTQQTQFEMAAPAPVKGLADTNMPAMTLQAQVGDTLQLQKLPQLTSQTTETLPLQMMTPAKQQTLQPQYRQQIINQDVIQPIIQTQPYLRVRHITQNVYQPTLQKQPVIQTVITQPVLHRTIHQQPIIQQQLQEQTVVKRRVINQPQVQQALQTQYQKAPQQVQESMGEALPAQTQMNAKVAAILSGQADGGAQIGYGGGQGQF